MSAQEPALMERVPPQSIEAEMAVLGAMMLEEEGLIKALEILEPSFFYKEAHQQIFKAILSLYEKGQPIDLVTLTELFQTTHQLERIGGASYLAGLATAVPTAANAESYARIVKEKAILRRLIQTSTQIVTESYDRGHDVSELLDHAERMIFEITQEKITGDFVSFKQIIRSSIETIDRLYQRKENVTGLPTGFHEFDAKTAGLQPSDFIVIAGRPSMGKSALACGIVEHVAVQEKLPVAFFSLEMSKEALVQRMLCSYAHVDAHRVRTGSFPHSDWPRLTAAAGKLSEAPIFIDDAPAISVLELRAKARRLRSKHPLALIVVDYMQMLQSAGRSENRQQEISEISRSLKALAKELNLPLIAISQLSRAVESRQDRRPQLSDLRESGAIEQDADLVVLLLREEYYGATDENRGKAEAIIAKQRNGPTGSIQLAFIKEFTRFENLSLRQDVPQAGAGS